MIDLRYSLIIEATDDPSFFGFFSAELEGFSGIGHSIEDCIYKAKWGMEEHVTVLRENRLPVPNPDKPEPKKRTHSAPLPYAVRGGAGKAPPPRFVKTYGGGAGKAAKIKQRKSIYDFLCGFSAPLRLCVIFFAFSAKISFVTD